MFTVVRLVCVKVGAVGVDYKLQRIGLGQVFRCGSVGWQRCPRVSEPYISNVYSTVSESS
jgi:hypothetical protein